MGVARQSTEEGRPWTLEEAQRTVGFRLKVWWDGDRRWYSGRVVKVNEATRHCQVKYDDGERKSHPLWNEHLVWLDEPAVAGVRRQGLPLLV